MDARLAWIWLSLACGAGSRVPLSLLRQFETPENILNADRKALAAALDKDIALLSRLSNKDTSDALEIIRFCDRAGVTILTPMDARYPKTLYQLRDIPCVLYCAGELPDFEKNCACAVVGTRKMSDYGRQMAYSIGRGLGAGGAVLVSGLALGVDGMAMAGALSGGGITVGVLGCGIDIVYPNEHKDLFKRVVREGAILTEYPPGTPPAGKNFPVRNRIISGLCDAVVVVEGDLKSGSLITARHALYQGRDLYAVPGRIGESGSAAPNLLIKTGARAITEAGDVLKNYEFIYPHSVNLKACAAALAEDASPDDVKDVAVRLHVRASDSPQYYGEGNYGGKSPRQTTPPRQKSKPVNRQPVQPITPAKMHAQISESEAKVPKNVIPANLIGFDLLDDTAKKVYAAMTADVPTLIDDIPLRDLKTSEILSALTLLELCGAVECSAGSHYIKRTFDDPILSDPDKS